MLFFIYAIIGMQVTYVIYTKVAICQMYTSAVFNPMLTVIIICRIYANATFFYFTLFLTTSISSNFRDDSQAESLNMFCFLQVVQNARLISSYKSIHITSR